jgi:hypothetical protein
VCPASLNPVYSNHSLLNEYSFALRQDIEILDPKPLAMVVSATTSS